MLRKFRNISEDRMQRQMRAAVERHGAELHEKVRIADVIDIDHLDVRELGTYALQAHFDFVLIDEHQKAVAAFEFDGPGHDSSKNGKKDAICQQANLPLLRVYDFKQVREINPITLARYLVELVFHARVFLQMQRDGSIAHDEPFMLSGFLKSNAKNLFDSEFDFIANANGKLTKALQNCGLTSDPLPHLSISRLVVQAPDGRLHAFMSINTSKGPIIGSSSLRLTVASPGFLGELCTVDWEIAEFAIGMAADDLLENIRLVADGHEHIVPSAAEVLAEITQMGSQGYVLTKGGGGSRAEANLWEAFAKGRASKSS